MRTSSSSTRSPAICPWLTLDLTVSRAAAPPLLARRTTSHRACFFDSSLLRACLCFSVQPTALSSSSPRWRLLGWTASTSWSVLTLCAHDASRLSRSSLCLCPLARPFSHCSLSLCVVCSSTVRQGGGRHGSGEEDRVAGHAVGIHFQAHRHRRLWRAAVVICRAMQCKTPARKKEILGGRIDAIALFALLLSSSLLRCG